MAKPRVSKQTISKAVNSLLKWIHSQHSRTSNSSPNSIIYLILTLKFVPHAGRSLSFPLPLPHPLNPNPSLIVSDHNPSLPSVTDTIESLSLPIAVTLFSLISSLEDRFYLADLRIASKLRRMKMKKGTRIVTLDFSKKSWPETARRALGSTTLNFRGGTCCGIEVARAEQGREEVLENLEAALEGAVGHVPKKWRNVRALHVKTVESVALPIYEIDESGGGGEKKRKGEREVELEENKRRKVEA